MKLLEPDNNHPNFLIFGQIENKYCCCSIAIHNLMFHLNKHPTLTLDEIEKLLDVKDGGATYEGGFDLVKTLIPEFKTNLIVKQDDEVSYIENILKCLDNGGSCLVAFSIHEGNHLSLLSKSENEIYLDGALIESLDLLAGILITPYGNFQTNELYNCCFCIEKLFQNETKIIS